MTKPRETLHFQPPIQIKGDYMIRFTSSEVRNFIFIITQKNNKFERYKLPDGKRGGVFHMKKSELRLKEAWKFQILQLPIYEMK